MIKLYIVCIATCAILLCGSAPIHSEDAPQYVYFQCDGYILCKPPRMWKGDSTDCIALPPNSVLRVKLPDAEPQSNENNPDSIEVHLHQI